MSPLELVRLSALMERSQGRPEIAIALVDGPVVLDHPELAGATIREIPAKLKGTCTRADTMACMHGTFVAGILFARRGSVAQAICPGCTLLLRPIFAEAVNGNGQMPSATPEDLAEAIVDSVNGGAHIINLSSALILGSPKGESKLEEALNYAVHCGAITVAAAGNQGRVGSSVITRHSGVIPVAACNPQGQPLAESNLGSSIGRRGLTAPGEKIISLGTNGRPQTFGGTSAAAPFVTGAIALLWDHGKVTNLGSLGGKFGNQAHNMNNRGQVVGASDLAGDAVFHGFVWSQSTGMQDVPPLAGDTYSVALSISDAGVVGGVSIDASFTILRAFIVVDGVPTDLNTLIPADSPLQLQTACTINSRGEIVGFAIEKSTGQIRGYLAIPVAGASPGR
jgi:subtilisin family serine protease